MQDELTYDNKPSAPRQQNFIQIISIILHFCSRSLRYDILSPAQFFTPFIGFIYRLGTKQHKWVYKGAWWRKSRTWRINKNEFNSSTFLPLFRSILFPLFWSSPMMAKGWSGKRELFHFKTTRVEELMKIKELLLGEKNK